MVDEVKQNLTRRKILQSGAAGIGLVGLGSLGLAGCKKADKTTDSPKTKLAREADVIVIGAGLSGLNATLLLEEMGHKVILVEGRDRVGGRVFTMDEVPGNPEGGADGIGWGYGRLLHQIEKNGVKLQPERDSNPRDNIVFNIFGENINFKDWASHPSNPMPEEFRAMNPARIPWKFYREDNPLKAVSDFVEPQFARHDISIYKYLQSKGFDHESIMLMASTNQSYGDQTGAHGISTLFMYNVMTNIMSGPSAPEGQPPTRSAVGGNMRVPEAMATNVKTDLRFGQTVVGIRSEKDHGEVHLADGQILKAKRIIVTLPFSALRMVNLDAPVTPQQSLAIRTLGYTNITHISMTYDREFWKDDGMEPSMWTDGPCGRFSALRHNPDNPDEITSFQASASGNVAHYLDRIGEEAATKTVLDYLARIRPSTKGALKPVKFWSWQLDPFAGGSYAAWRPGQISTYGKNMAQPAGRIHFAGEHTSQVARGMEAAMESGERSAFEVAELI